VKGIPPRQGLHAVRSGLGRWEKNSLDGDNSLQVRFDARAGTRLLALSLPGRRWVPDDSPVLPPRAGREENATAMIDIKTVEISGPFNVKKPEISASRRKIFSCYPASEAEQERCASTILATLAKRAYRRPVSDRDVQTLMQFCRSGLAHGFDACIQTALERILASPYFLYRVEGPLADSEQPPAGKAFAGARSASRSAKGRGRPGRHAVGGTRADQRSGSGFAAVVLPLEQHSGRSAAGPRRRSKLRDPGVLDKQVRRMLADPRSRALVNNFADQWLGLRRLEAATPSSAISRISTASFACHARRDRALHRQHVARRSADSRAPLRELLLHQREAGPALPDSEHRRQPLPSGDDAA
jgi:hypothetical protein